MREPLNEEADMMMQKTNASMKEQLTPIKKGPVNMAITTSAANMSDNSSSSFLSVWACREEATAAAPRNVNIKDPQRNRMRNLSNKPS